MASATSFPHSTITFIDKEHNPYIYDAYASQILRFGSEHLCMKHITKEFLEEVFELNDFLFVHTFNDEIRGFACVQEITYPKHYLYIDLICNAPFHKMSTRSTEHSTKFGGRNLLDAIKRKAIELGAKSIKLSALDHVITYYYHLGYRFMNNELRETLEKRLMKELQYAQRHGYDEASEIAIDRIIGRFYPGFYSEAKQRELSEYNTVKERKEVVRRDGVPMILHLTTEGVIGGSKRSHKRHNSKTIQTHCNITRHKTYKKIFKSKALRKTLRKK